MPWYSFHYKAWFPSLATRHLFCKAAQRRSEDALIISMHVRTRSQALQQCSWRCARFPLVVQDYHCRVCPRKTSPAVRLLVSPRGIHYFPLPREKHTISTMWYLITGFRRAPEFRSDDSAKRKTEMSSGTVWWFYYRVKSLTLTREITKLTRHYHHWDLLLSNCTTGWLSVLCIPA